MINLKNVESGIAAARALASHVVDDLDPAYWSHETTDPGAAADSADYVVGATRAIVSNLESLAIHFQNYKEIRYSQDSAMRINMSKTGKPFTTSEDRPRFDERALRIKTYESAVFVAIGSVLDTLAASLIGFAGLRLDIQRADFGWFLPMHTRDYPSKEQNSRIFRALADDGTAARQKQVETLRSFVDALEQSGPAGWVRWSLGMRNMFVHREHRDEAIIFKTKNRALTCAYLPVSDPLMSNLKAFRSSPPMSKGRYLEEDVQNTMSGLIDSLNCAVVRSVAVLTRLWEERKANPALIRQPSSPGRERIGHKEFEGYSPGSAVIKKNMKMIMNPEDVARLKAGRLFGY